MDKIFDFIDKHINYYSHCLVRIASDYYDEKHKFCLYKIEFADKSSKQHDSVEYDYGNFKLVQRSLSLSESIEILSDFNNGKLEIDNQTYSITSDSLNQKFITSGNTYGFTDVDWPTHYFEYSLPNPPFKQLAPFDLTPVPKLPLYSTSVDAATAFLDLKRDLDYPFIDSRIVIMIPDLELE